MSFEPQNPLEEALINAAKGSAAKSQFLKKLLGSEVLVNRLTASDGSELQDQLHIEAVKLNGMVYLPFFSSPDRLHAFHNSGTNDFALNGRKFLEATRGSNVVLNPGTDYTREFSAEEIADLLEGAIWLPPDQKPIEKETQIMIGQPANYPTELVETLKRFFKRRDEVKRAWLGHIYNPDTDESAHSLIAIEVDDNWDEVSSQTGTVASAVAIPDPPVDILQISGNGGIENYFLNSVEPFYVREKNPQVS